MPTHKVATSASPPSALMATDKVVTDWEGIERDYRAGLLSVREIGGLYGVSHPAILKRAKALGWERDLSAKIKARADAKVTKAAVTALVTAGIAANESQIVEANAEVISRVRLAHRTDIGRSRGLALKLLSELEHQTDFGDLYEKLADLLHGDGDDDGSEAAKQRRQKQLEAFQRAMSLGGRTKTMKDLADTLKTLVALEREAYGLTTDQKPAAPIKDLTDDELQAKFDRLASRFVKPPAPGRTLQ